VALRRGVCGIAQWRWVWLVVMGGANVFGSFWW
jgi:hypothetical protein